MALVTTVLAFYIMIETKLLLEKRYDTIEEFKVDSKAECGQFNLAHVARKI